MKLSKGEFSQFSLKGRWQLIKEFGELIEEVTNQALHHRLYRLFDFYVEVYRPVSDITPTSVELVRESATLLYFQKEGQIRGSNNE